MFSRVKASEPSRDLCLSGASRGERVESLGLCTHGLCVLVCRHVCLPPPARMTETCVFRARVVERESSRLDSARTDCACLCAGVSSPGDYTAYTQAVVFIHICTPLQHSIRRMGKHHSRLGHVKASPHAAMRRVGKGVSAWYRQVSNTYYRMGNRSRARCGHAQRIARSRRILRRHSTRGSLPRRACRYGDTNRHSHTNLIVADSHHPHTRSAACRMTRSEVSVQPSPGSRRATAGCAPSRVCSRTRTRYTMTWHH